MISFKPARPVLAGIAAAAAAAAAALVPTGDPAGAATVPFADHNASGYIGLCNEAGQSITSGSLTDDPFVWTAVSSVPVPSGYGQGKATLYVFQPRKNVDPGQWSGEQVTGSSSYTNPAHPMVQATSADAPLISVDGAFPPVWNGLYQLRMYFTGENLEPYTQSYPATVIQVSGNRWSVVQGGTVPCNSGKATSSEVAALNDPSLRTPQSVGVTPGAAPGSVNSGQGAAIAGQPGSSTTTGGQSAAAGGSSSSGNPSSRLSASGRLGARASNGGGMSTGAVAALALIGVAVLAGGGAGVVLWRRRAAGHGAEGPVPTAQ